MNFFQYTLIFIVYAIAIGGAWLVLIKRPQVQEAQRPKEDPKLDLTYEQAIGILDYGIASVIEVKMKDYRLRDVRMPYDFKKEHKDLVTKVMQQFTPQFLAVLTQYHPRDEIIRRVSRSASDFLIEYIRKYKVKTK